MASAGPGSKLWIEPTGDIAPHLSPRDTPPPRPTSSRLARAEVEDHAALPRHHPFEEVAHQADLPREISRYITARRVATEVELAPRGGYTRLGATSALRIQPRAGVLLLSCTIICSFFVGTFTKAP